VDDLKKWADCEDKQKIRIMLDCAIQRDIAIAELRKLELGHAKLCQDYTQELAKMQICVEWMYEKFNDQLSDKEKKRVEKLLGL